MDRALAYTNAGGGGGGGGVGGWGKGRRRQIQKESGCPQAAIDYQKSGLQKRWRPTKTAGARNGVSAHTNGWPTNGAYEVGDRLTKGVTSCQH